MLDSRPWLALLELAWLFFVVDIYFSHGSGLLELGTAFHFGGLFLGNMFKSFSFRWTVYKGISDA